MHGDWRYARVSARQRQGLLRVGTPPPLACFFEDSIPVLAYLLGLNARLLGPNARPISCCTLPH